MVYLRELLTKLAVVLIIVLCLCVNYYLFTAAVLCIDETGAKKLEYKDYNVGHVSSKSNSIVLCQFINLFEQI